MLENGVQQLVQQCYELGDLIVQTNEVSPGPKSARLPYQPSKPTKLRTSKLADKQMALGDEEGSWMQKIVLGCWTTLLADAARTRRAMSTSKSSMQPLLKARSITS